MGARLVSLALARWTHVSERAFRVLVRMAVTALDEPHKDTPAAVYFGGRELLAMTLRSEKGTADTRYRTVKRALAELIAEGAIERTSAARSGQNAVYRLTLDGARYIDEVPSIEPVQGDTSGPPEGDRRDPPQGDTRSPFRGTVETPPRNQEEPLEELLEEESVDLHTAVTVARAPEPDEEPAVVVEIFPGALQEPPFVTAPPGRRLTRAQQTLAEAAANREAARRAHRARMEAT